MANKKRIELLDANVIFDKEAHTYHHIDGTELSGITPMLSRQLGDDLSLIPGHILEKATDRGLKTHDSLEQFTTSWVDDNSEDVAAFKRLVNEHNICSEAAEYTVTTYNTNSNYPFASNIDLVARVDEDTFDLYDFKTCCTMDATRLMKAKFQLSLYKEMFLMTNPKAKVRNCSIIWIRNTEKDHIAKIIEIKPVDRDTLFDMLDAELRGDIFVNPYLIPEDLASQEEYIRSLIQQKNEAEEKLAQIKASIMQQMTEMDVKTWATETMRLTRKLPTTRQPFQLAALKADYPDIPYDDYMKTSQVSGSLLIAV